MHDQCLQRPDADASEEEWNAYFTERAGHLISQAVAYVVIQNPDGEFASTAAAWDVIEMGEGTMTYQVLACFTPRRHS